MRTIILATMLMATPAAAADQFDLVCTAKKEQQRYRIDLGAGEWCSGDCSTVRKIAEVTTGMITLVNLAPQPPRNETTYNRINRQTGAWEWFNEEPGYSSIQDIKGSCSASPFSGFPAAKF